MTNETQTRLDEENMDYIDDFLYKDLITRQECYPIQVSEVELIPLEKVLACQTFVKSCQPSRALVDHPNCNHRFSGGDHYLTPEETKDLFEAVSKVYKTSKIFRLKRVSDPSISTTWRDLKVTTSSLCSKDSFQFKNSKAYPDCLLVESYNRTKKDLEEIIPVFQQKVLDLKGKIFPYLWNGYSCLTGSYSYSDGLKGKIEAISTRRRWIESAWLDVNVGCYTNEENFSFKRDIAIHSNRGSALFGICTLEYILPNSTLLTRQKIAQ